MKKALSFLTVLVLLVGLLAVFPVSADVWDGTTADEFAGGSGTEDDPYQIATAEQLAAKLVTQGVRGTSCYFEN